MRRKPYTIGVDVMGSDHPPFVLMDAIESLIPEISRQNIQILVIGTPDVSPPTPLLFHSVPHFVDMQDDPLHAFKKKKDASLFEGLRLLKQKKIDAFVTAGNTGALVLGSKLLLSMISPILRPALAVHLPTKKKIVSVLDVGANIQYKAAHLIQFAFMGAAYWQYMGISKPKIGLLNIGSEPIKGTSELKNAYNFLQNIEKAPFSFFGNVEGKSVFEGEVDTLITDGFTGNIFLKTTEGIANLILDKMTEKYKKTAKSELQALKKYLHYAEYPGALLLGVKGLVVKCHGYSTPLAFANAIRGTCDLVQKGFMQSFQSRLKKMSVPTKRTLSLFVK